MRLEPGPSSTSGAAPDGGLDGTPDQGEDVGRPTHDPGVRDFLATFSAFMETANEQAQRQRPAGGPSVADVLLEPRGPDPPAQPGDNRSHQIIENSARCGGTRL